MSYKESVVKRIKELQFRQQNIKDSIGCLQFELSEIQTELKALGPIKNYQNGNVTSTTPLEKETDK